MGRKRWLFGSALLLSLFLVGLVSAAFPTDDVQVYYALDETTGARFNDSVIGDLNGTLRQMENSDWVDGLIGNSLLFDGNDEYGQANGTSRLNPDVTNASSISFWVNVTSAPNNDDRYVVFGNNIFYVKYLAAGGLTATLTGTAAHNANSNKVPTTDAWVHVVATFNSSTLAIYVNGTLEGTSDTSQITPTHRNIVLSHQGDPSGAGSFTIAGKLDEIGFWNRSLTASEVSDLYNGGAGVAFGSISIDLSTPADGGAAIIPNFTTTITATSGQTVTNATIFVWNSSHQLINETFRTLSGTANTTVFELGGIQIDTLRWNVFGCDSSNSCTFDRTNNTFDFGYVLNSQTFDATVGDLSNSTFILNLTLHPDVFSSVSTLVYDGTNYSTTSTSDGTNEIFTRILEIPAVSATTIRNFFWRIVLSDSFQGTFTTTAESQTVTTSLFGYCNASLVTEAINFTIYEESLRTPLNISNFDATFFWSLTPGGTSKNASFSLQNDSSYRFCIEPNATFYVDSSIRLQNPGYTERTYEISQTVLNHNITERLLYMINTTEPTDVIIELKDLGLRPLADYTVQIFRKDLGVGDQYLVEEDETDEFGQIVTSLVENTVRYEFRFLDEDDVLIKRLPNVLVVCESSPCKQQFIVDPEVDSFEDFDDLEDHSFSLVFNNDTNIFSYSWVDNRGESSTHRLLVERILFNGTTVVCNQTDSSSSDLLTCNVGSSRASYRASAFRQVGTDEDRLDLINVDVGNLAHTFSFEGLFWSFILTLIMILIGRFYPPVGVILYLFGMFLLGIFDIVFINPAIMIAQIVIGVIFIWAFRG